MTKHTPGPWQVDPRADNHVIAASRPICSVSYSNTADTEGTRAENAATARLIAAAPDLLEALKVATDLIESHTGHSKIINWQHAAGRRLPELRAAIAKAKGKE